MEQEELAKGICLLPEYQTGAGRRVVAFQGVNVVVVIKEAEVLGSPFVQPVLKRDIVDETLILVGILGAGRNFAADFESNAVVPQMFGKLEGIVCLRIAGSRRAAFYADGDIYCFQGVTGNVLNFILKESVEGVIGLERRFVSAGKIHSRCEHADGQLAAFFL